MIVRCRVVPTSELAIEIIGKVTLYNQLIVTVQLTLKSHRKADGASRLTMRRMHVLGPAVGPRERLLGVFRLQAAC
jgi:hypothetical protein